MELKVELKEQVLVLEEVVGLREGTLALDQRRHRREVLLAGVHRGELRHARLEQAARLEYAGDLAHAYRLPAPQQIARDQLGRDEDPTRLPAPHREHAGLGEDLHGLTQGRAADAHLGGELALGWQPVAHVKVARLDALGDLLDRLLEGTA